MGALYEKALRQSNKGSFAPGSVSIHEGSLEQTQAYGLRQSRQQTEEAYARGELTDEEYDAAMDEFDRAEEERLSRSMEKYSFAGENANNADLEALESAKKMQTDGIL